MSFCDKIQPPESPAVFEDQVELEKRTFLFRLRKTAPPVWAKNKTFMHRFVTRIGGKSTIFDCKRSYICRGNSAAIVWR